MCLYANEYLLLGVKMDIHSEDEPANIFADNEILDCNMPASHKCNGTVGHSHDFHPCAFCDVNMVKVNTPEDYNNCRYHPLAACLLIFCLAMQPTVGREPKSQESQQMALPSYCYPSCIVVLER